MPPATRVVIGEDDVLMREGIARILGRRACENPLAALTPRERDVLGAMAEGKSNIGIAGDH